MSIDDENDNAELRTALEQLAQRPKVLLAADFDGTLAPLVTDPMSSRALPGAMEALEEASRLPGVTAALVSGRDLATLTTLARLVEDSPVVLVGSHGAQSSASVQAEALTPQTRELLEALTQDLTAAAQAHPGARIEHKPVAVALHTRGIDAQVGAAALAAAREVGARHTGVHVVPGKDVVELTVFEASKGAALRTLQDAVGADAVAYFGDDLTDERAFEALDAAEGHVTVKVGEGPTVAAYRVHDAADVVAALQLFVQRRRGSAGDGSV